MKATLLALCILFIQIRGGAQVITYDDFKAVIPSLQSEDFKTAFEKTNQLLRSTQNDSSDLRAIVTYMNIFSAAGMVSLDQMTHADFLQKAKQYIGQHLIMSAHPFIDSTAQGFNSLKLVTVKGRLQGATMAANSKKSSILCFEYFTYKDPPNPADFVGKNVRCGGTLESVEVNPNNSKIWIARLHIGNAFARAMTPR